MIPVWDPYGFVDGRQVRPTGQQVQTSPRGPQDSIDDTERPAGFSLAPHEPHKAGKKLVESHVSEGDWYTQDMWKEWLPERIVTDLQDVHIIHFSGEVKMWHRFLEGSTDSDEEFAKRLLDDNTGYFSRLFIKKEGTKKEYENYGIELVNGKFRCPLSKEPEAIGKTIERSVEHVKNAALIATREWREVYERLPAVLECTQEDLLEKIQKPSSGISSGMKFTCAVDWGLTIWESANEWNEVGKLNFGDEAIAEGEPECFQFYERDFWMMPISKPMTGSVEIRYLEPYAEAIESIDKTRPVHPSGGL